MGDSRRLSHVVVVDCVSCIFKPFVISGSTLYAITTIVRGETLPRNLNTNLIFVRGTS